GLPWMLYLSWRHTDGMVSTLQLQLSYAALVAIAAGVIIVLRWQRTPLVARVLASWHSLCAVGAVAAIAVALLISPATTASNLIVVPQNMLLFARWGMFWDLALLVALALAAGRLMRVDLTPSPYAALAAITVLALGLVFLVGALRHPYRFN